MNTDSTISSLLGPAAPELGWVPAPRYLMRRARIRHLMRNLPVGRLLEIGPGAGALSVEFSQKGFQCEALELSVEARELAQTFIRKFRQNIPIHAQPDTGWKSSFDVLCAFEVLEHIENDREALEQWASWLKPDGRLLLSVPAHMKLWNARDEWAGHVRRYERASLQKVFWGAGLEIETFECYGFPLTNLTERISAPIYNRDIYSGGETSDDDRKRNNDRSGIDRSPDLKTYPLLRSIPGKLALQVFAIVQAAFINTDLGSGYIVKAKRR
ncbi:class I SAM-dependent methyltransferase [Glaciimonas soli]|uniref:Methyltransferase domain-containing protein n=1 Tax=Glaciimonas soli TaxID=2590999 RepID=A0A843YN74_9BURK|nr:class I SAM-dependent methyltransferase [Glaciimonas soli]MQR01309.1 methyltransferase domain-containing protein [Glaciimonas soli]